MFGTSRCAQTPALAKTLEEISENKCNCGFLLGSPGAKGPTRRSRLHRSSRC